MSEMELAKWSRVRAGETVRMTDKELDAIDEHFKDSDSPEASDYFLRCHSIPDPQRIGVIGIFLVSLRSIIPEEKPKRRKGKNLLDNHLRDVVLF